MVDNVSHIPGGQSAVLTIDATPTQLCLLPIPMNQTRGCDFRIRARRTGGSAGTTGDSGFYNIATVARNISGVVTLLSQVASVSVVDQDEWACLIDVSGAAIRCMVIGAANNDVSWTVNWTET